jgi:hypothetical protein
MRRAIKSVNRQPFEVQSYLVELCEDGERPPRSAKMVAYLDLGSGPGGGDYRIYSLSTNRERSLWILWLTATDWDKPLYGRVATGRPYRGYPARFAAEQLLIKSWQDERAIGWLQDRARVMEEGLLNKQDIHRINMAVFVEDV